MTNFEEPLAQALRDVPTKGQRPIELIERRARTIRHRRRSAVAGIALAAAGAVAVPSLGTFAGGTVRDAQPAAPAITTPASTCDSWTGEQRGEFRTLAEVPDQMRLLWTQSAPQPTEANMIDFSNAEEIVTDRIPANCEIPESTDPDDEHAGVWLFNVEDNVVTRVVSVSGPNPKAPQAYDGRRVIETEAGPLELSAMRYDRRQAVWPAEGTDGYWVSWIHGEMSDAELIELAESVTLANGRVDIANWSGATDRTVILQASDLKPDPDRDLTSFNLMGGPVSLWAWEGPFSGVAHWDDVEVGDQLVDINGQPGVLRTGPSGRVRWVSSDGILVQVNHTGRDSQVELLDIARSVGPVAADDERLTAIWQDEPPADAGD
ncbi:MAG TPA: hypothetical protein VFZ85_17385 [Jiangellaceae bacterium]